MLFLMTRAQGLQSVPVVTGNSHNSPRMLWNKTMTQMKVHGTLWPTTTPGLINYSVG